MSKNPTFLEEFRSFYFQNKPKDIEEAIKYFAVFGGTGWSVDTKKELFELIEEKFLKNYKYIHSDITTLTHSDKTAHALLSAAAMGDRRLFSSFKKARISRDEGEEAVDKLCKSGIIKIEESLELPPLKADYISEKIDFNREFIRFWFTFVSPFYKSIKTGDYKEIKERFENRKDGFSDLVFLKLSMELLKLSFSDDPITEIGGYWDKNTEIDILAKTESGKLIAGTCKYSNAKVKKSELGKLKQSCKVAELEPDICVIIAKNGFSNELKALKGADLRLFSLKNLRPLVAELGKADLLKYEGKKY